MLSVRSSFGSVLQVKGELKIKIWYEGVGVKDKRIFTFILNSKLKSGFWLDLVFITTRSDCAGMAMAWERIEWQWSQDMVWTFICSYSWLYLYSTSTSTTTKYRLSAFGLFVLT